MVEALQSDTPDHPSYMLPSQTSAVVQVEAHSSHEFYEDKDDRHQGRVFQPSTASETDSTASQDATAELNMEWLKILEEDSAVILQTIGLGSSFVAIGAGLDVRSIKCGFDTRLVEMKNLLLGTPLKDVEELLNEQGVGRRTFRILSTQQYGDGPLRVVLLAHKDAAEHLAAKLDGTTFRGKTIEFNVVGHNSLHALQSVAANILTISWEVPPMIVILTYRDPRMAHRFAKHLNEEGFGGHKLEAYVVPAQAGSLTQIRTTAVPNGLDCLQLHFLSRAQSILLQPAFDSWDLINSIKQFLGLNDTVQICFRTAACMGKQFGVLNITFDSWDTAKRACQLLSGRKIKAEYPMLRCYLPFMKPIQSIVYIPLERCFAHSWDSFFEQHRKGSITSRMHSNYGCIPPVGENVGSAPLAVSVEKLSLFEEEELSYWHWACSSMPFLHILQTRLSISLIEICWATRTLKIFAEDQMTLMRAVRLIRVDVARSSLVQQVITTDRRLIRSLQGTGALRMLKQKFGTEGLVSLDVSPCRSLLKHPNVPLPAFRKFLSQQKDHISTHGRLEDDGIGISCPICLDDFSDPDTTVQRLACGHAYCMECLQQFLVTAPERNKLPLVCIGNEDRCRLVIPIPLIQSLLSPQQFDTLIEKALSAYIEQRPLQYKYCPTASCGQLYRCTPGVVLTSFCPSCMLHLCTACQKPAHPGLTCAERRERDPAEHDALNAEWASSNGAKQCPTCQVWVQKTEGCNHVTCRCGAHICWVCGKAFESGRQTYRHLGASHGEEPLYQVPLGRRMRVQELGMLLMGDFPRQDEL